MNLKAHEMRIVQALHNLKKKSLVSVGTLGFGAGGQRLTSAERCIIIMVCFSQMSIL